MSNSHYIEKLIKQGRTWFGYNQLPTYDYSPEIVTFANEVLKKIPNSFAISTGRMSTIAIGVHGYPVTLGQISVTADYSRNRHGKTVYEVSSPKINNRRGDTHSKSSINLKTAVKNASKYFSRSSYFDIASGWAYRIQEARGGVVDQYDREYGQAIYNLFNTKHPDKDFEQDILKLYKEGYTFHPTVQGRLQEIEQKKIARAEKVEDKPNAMLLVITTLNTRMERSHCVVVRLNSTGGDKVSSTYGVNREQHVQTYRIQDVPEDIAAPITMIDMVDRDEYLEGYGVCLEEGVYAVEVRDAPNSET